jgi:hypothetical protein
MIPARTLTMVALGLVLSTHTVQSQERARYRDFQLGSDVPSVSALTGVAASEAKIVHQRPAVMQELEWRPHFSLGSVTPTQTDPVQQIIFSFYDDQLSRMVVDYDRDKTAGMTNADMIEAISTAYGPPLKPAVKQTRTVLSQLEVESGTAVARWGDADYSVVLYRSSNLYGSSSSSRFRLIVTSSRLEALARTADAQAIRLDAHEAPQREIARQKKEVTDARVSQEKARLANKAAFRP